MVALRRPFVVYGCSRPACPGCTRVALAVGDARGWTRRARASAPLRWQPRIHYRVILHSAVVGCATGLAGGSSGGRNSHWPPAACSGRCSHQCAGCRVAPGVVVWVGGMLPLPKRQPARCPLRMAAQPGPATLTAAAGEPLHALSSRMRAGRGVPAQLGANTHERTTAFTVQLPAPACCVPRPLVRTHARAGAGAGAPHARSECATMQLLGRLAGGAPCTCAGRAQQPGASRP